MLRFVESNRAPKPISSPSGAASARSQAIQRTSHPAAALAQHVRVNHCGGTVEEPQGVEGLVLRRSGDVPVDRQVAKERFDLARSGEHVVART